MHKISLTIGHNVGNVEIFDTASICRTVAEFLHLDAFTAIPCLGMWKGTPEHSTRIEVMLDESEVPSITSLIPTLAAKLNQEAIMCEIAPANVSFPSAVVPAIA